MVPDSSVATSPSSLNPDSFHTSFFVFGSNGKAKWQL